MNSKMKKSEKNDDSVLDVEAYPFYLVCQLFQKLLNCKQNEKRELLSKLFMKFGTSQNVHSLIRLLVPSYDGDRATYGVKIRNLSKLYVKAMALPDTSPHAKRLLNYVDPRSGRYGKVSAGDFPNILGDVLKVRGMKPHTDPRKVTVSDVNRLLDAMHSATHKQSREKVIVKAYQAMTLEMQVWFVRIMLKDLKIHTGPNFVLGVFHPRGVEMYNICNNLAKVCACAADVKLLNSEFPAVAQLKLFNAFRPMLCGRTNWRDILKKFGSNPFYVEDKYDGERMLVHYSRANGGKVMLFTRNANNYTNKYGAIMAPLLRECVRDTVTDCVFDGEMMSWDEVNHRFVAFGHNRTVAMAQSSVDGNGVGGVHLCYVAMDLLFVNGVSILHNRLDDRRKLLVNAVMPKAHHFETVPYREDVKTLHDVMSALDDATIVRKMEGIVLKRVDSVYSLAERSSSWIKLKRDYIEGMGDTLDCIILGGYYSESVRKGGRAGTLSHFLLGVAESTMDGTPPKNFYTFCKVGTGLSTSELRELQQKIRPYLREYDMNEPPPHLMGWSPTREDIPHRWLPPEYSFLIELRCAELTECVRNKFLAQITARFPRIVKIRYDKDWMECATLQEIVTTFETQSTMKRKAAVDYLNSANIDDESGSKKKKRRVQRRARKQLVAKDTAPDLNGIDLSGHEQVLNGLEFCVVSDDDNMTRDAIQIMVQMYGGTLTQNPRAGVTHCVLGGRRTAKLQSLILGGRFDVIHYQWLVDSVNAKTMLPYWEEYPMSLTEESQFVLEHSMDQWHDHYTFPANPSSLRDSLMRIDDSSCLPEVTRAYEAELSSWERAELRLSEEINFFKGMVVYLPMHEYDRSIDLTKPPPPPPDNAAVVRASFGSRVMITACELRLHGAQVEDHIHGDVNYVVLPTITCIHPREVISDVLERMNLSWKCEIVSEDWVHRCVEAHRIVEIDHTTF